MKTADMDISDDASIVTAAASLCTPAATAAAPPAPTAVGSKHTRDEGPADDAVSPPKKRAHIDIGVDAGNNGNGGGSSNRVDGEGDSNDNDNNEDVGGEQEGRNVQLPPVTSSFELVRLPNDLNRLVGEFLQYKEVVRLARTSHTLKAQLKSVAIWDRIEMHKWMEHPAAMGSLRSGLVGTASEMLNLPASLTRLTFAYKFNHPIEQLKLPASLTYFSHGDG